MGELSSKTPDKILDVMGRVCPYPLVLTKKELEKMSSGQLLKVLTDAPASAEDSLPKYAAKQGHKFESVKNDAQGSWEIYIQKV